MPFLFKLSRRAARFRSRASIVAAAALIGCEPEGLTRSTPSHPCLAITPPTPGTVADLAVASVSTTSATLSFTEVDDGTGLPARYDIRSAPGTMTWGSAAGVVTGTCATPVPGSAIGSMRTCTVAGLVSGTAYSFQLVAFRGALDQDAVFGPLSNVASGQTGAGGTSPSASECATPQAAWIWCDDFEQDRLSQYFEYDNAGGSFDRVGGVGVAGSTGMRAHYAAGQVSVGALHLAMGKVPSSSFRPVDAGTAVYRDVYWRLYVRYQAGWVGGGGNKLARETAV